MTSPIVSSRSLRSAPASNLVPTALWLLNRQLDIVWWFLGLVVVVFAVSLPAIGRAGEPLPLSIWEAFAGNGPGWFLMAMGATAVSTYLPTVVAHGVTRRRFALSTTLALAACAAVLAVVVVIGYQYETAVYRRVSWDHVLLGSHMFGSTDQLHLVMAEYWVRYLLFGLVGVLSGYGFYRVGGWWGTALLPLTTLLPLAIGSRLLGQGTEVLSVPEWLAYMSATPSGALLTIGFMAVLFVVIRALLATVPLRTTVT